eukprot:XP_011663979.1 PREDICTED: uncharacterized protein LOC100889834 [Strongylocentrotus purpuratus]
MDKLTSQYNALARKVLIAAESGESEKFKGLFKGRQPEEVTEALNDVSQERYNDVLGNVRFTPLIAGAWHGHTDVIDELLDEYKMVIRTSTTPLSRPITADPRLEDMDGYSALHRLALKQRMYVLKNGPLPQIIDTLVESGAKMSVNQAGQTPLAAACASGNVEVARAIMCLPEVRPEEQLTAQEKLRKKLESDVIERTGSDEASDGDKTRKKTSWTQKFTNPNEIRKLKWSLKKSKKTVADKIEEIAENDIMETVEEIASP